MSRARTGLLLVGLTAGCSNSGLPESECRISPDCEAQERCLVNFESGHGRCIEVLGSTEDPPPRRVFIEPSMTDLLLVLDDGPTTAGLQARLVASLDALAAAVRTAGNATRLAVTTTSMVDAQCEPPHETTRGSYATLSCLDRLDDFIAPDGADARDLCTDRCAYTTEQLGLTPERPWLDLWDLPAGVTPEDALACLVPQGISGCERAASLQAVEYAVLLSLWSDEAESGFLREHELAHAVVVTDGVDCSLTDIGIDAFDPDGSRTLWSDPDAMAATEAVCWNAGVACEGDPTDFDACRSVDRDLDGEPYVDDDVAVLAPLEEFDLLERRLDLHVIGGIAPGDTEPSYSAIGDPQWLLEYGVDPGCIDGDVAALPPVRLRELASELTSACAPDYRDVLAPLPSRETICMRPCDASMLTVAFEAPDQAPQAVPPCDDVDAAFVVPAGAPACYALVTDSEDCQADPERSVELVLRAADPTTMPAFLLTPDPWSTYADAMGCAS